MAATSAKRTCSRNWSSCGTCHERVLWTAGADGPMTTNWRATRVRRPVLALVVGLVCIAAWCTSPAQAQHPNVARGFTPAGMFDMGGIDTVNGFNGNLMIRIPIGGSYPVGGEMGSYSFSL